MCKQASVQALCSIACLCAGQATVQAGPCATCLLMATDQSLEDNSCYMQCACNLHTNLEALWWGASHWPALDGDGSPHPGAGSGHGRDNGSGSSLQTLAVGGPPV